MVHHQVILPEKPAITDYEEKSENDEQAYIFQPDPSTFTLIMLGILHQSDLFFNDKTRTLLHLHIVLSDVLSQDAYT